MILFSIILITLSVGYLFGPAFGFLTLGVCIFLTQILRAVFRRIPPIQ